MIGARVAAVASVMVVVGAGAADMWVALRPPPAAPRAHALMDAASWVVSELRPDDRAVHGPLFAPDVLLDLPERIRGPSLPRLWRGRMFVIDSGETHVAASLLDRKTFDDGVEVRVYGPRVPDAEATFDILRDLEPGMVRIEALSGAVRATCDVVREPSGFSCPGEKPWVYAAVETVIIDGSPRACLWAHPISGAVLVVELPPFPGPGDWRLKLGGGLSDRAVQMSAGAPVTTTVRQGRETLGTLTVPNRRGWRETELAISPNRTTELRVRTRFDGMRHHCLTAIVRPLRSRSEGEERRSAQP
ncbi:MAG: hypothetical protein ACFB9M_16115 [Myxococcota bacterium]